jgi:hypothetical protein
MQTVTVRMKMRLPVMVGGNKVAGENRLQSEMGLPEKRILYIEKYDKGFLGKGEQVTQQSIK